MLVHRRYLARTLMAPMPILPTVTAAWNVWNFRRPLLQALLPRGDRVTVLAPSDRAEDQLARAGAQLLPQGTLTLGALLAVGMLPVGDLHLRPLEARHPVATSCAAIDAIVVPGGGENAERTASCEQVQLGQRRAADGRAEAGAPAPRSAALLYKR
jgi:hypothetical protein